jgi:hypothetical protein
MDKLLVDLIMAFAFFKLLLPIIILAGCPFLFFGSSGVMVEKGEKWYTE